MLGRSGTTEGQLGVPVDKAMADSYYLKAEALGSLRATHNLGMHDFERGKREAAIERLEKALQGGLRMPTLLNLGRAYAPDAPTRISEFESNVALATKAGDYYAQAFEASGEFELAGDAGRQYLAVYDWTLVGRYNYDLFEGADLPALRQRAKDWLSKAMEKGSARAWTNYGVMLLQEGKKDEARAAFERGAKADINVAHQHLGQMAEAANEPAEKVIAHYERALAKGHAPARRDVFRNLLQSLNREPRLDALERGIQRLQELRTEAIDREFGEDIEDLLHRYKRQKSEADKKQRASGKTKAVKKA